MSGFERYHRILRCFLQSESQWSVKALAEALDLPASTLYRGIRELVQHRFLESVGDSSYRLGPAFLEFERRLRESDPFIQSGGIFLPPLVRQSPIPICAALCRLQGNEVMCVADARTQGFEGSTAYERGKLMPILYGATSKAVLAALPLRRRDKIIAEAAARTTIDVVHLTAQLRQLKKQGFLITRGEVDARLAGIAASITLPGYGIYASLTLIAHQSDITPAAESRLAELVMTHASLIRQFMT